jgi:hypothetical protein
MKKLFYEYVRYPNRKIFSILLLLNKEVTLYYPSEYLTSMTEIVVIG